MCLRAIKASRSLCVWSGAIYEEQEGMSFRRLEHKTNTLTNTSPKGPFSVMQSSIHHSVIQTLLSTWVPSDMKYKINIFLSAFSDLKPSFHPFLYPCLLLHSLNLIVFQKALCQQHLVKHLFHLSPSFSLTLCVCVSVFFSETCLYATVRESWQPSDSWHPWLNSPFLSPRFLLPLSS